MAAGATDHVQSIGEIMALLDDKSLTSNRPTTGSEDVVQLYTTRLASHSPPDLPCFFPPFAPALSKYPQVSVSRFPPEILRRRKQARGNPTTNPLAATPFRYFAAGCSNDGFPHIKAGSQQIVREDRDYGAGVRRRGVTTPHRGKGAGI